MKFTEIPYHILKTFFLTQSGVSAIYTISVNNINGSETGTVVRTNSYPIYHGSTQTFTFTPAAGYHIDSLYIDGIEKTPTIIYTFENVTENHHISITFVKDNGGIIST